MCVRAHACAGRPFCLLPITVGVLGPVSYLHLRLHFEYHVPGFTSSLPQGSTPPCRESTVPPSSSVSYVLRGRWPCIPPQDTPGTSLPCCKPFPGSPHLHRPLPLFTVQGGHCGTEGTLTSWDAPLHCTFCKSHPQASPPAATLLAPHGVRPSSALREPASGFSRSTEIKIARGAPGYENTAMKQ